MLLLLIVGLSCLAGKANCLFRWLFERFTACTSPLLAHNIFRPGRFFQESLYVRVGSGRLRVALSELGRLLIWVQTASSSCQRAVTVDAQFLFKSCRSDSSQTAFQVFVSWPLPLTSSGWRLLRGHFRFNLLELCNELRVGIYGPIQVTSILLLLLLLRLSLCYKWIGLR